MNPSEAAVLLARVSASDNREVSEAAARAWADSLPDVALADALEYLPRFYRAATRDTKNWVYPGDVLDGVRALFDERCDAHVSQVRDAATEEAKNSGDEDTDPDMIGLRAAAKARREWHQAHPKPGAEIDKRQRQADERKHHALASAWAR